MTFFNEITQLPDDPIFGLPAAFASDPRDNKINLGIGAYKTAEGAPLVLAAVKKAEHILLQKKLNKEYLPIEGDGDFISNSLQLMLGIDSLLFNSSNFFAAQTVGGAGALRIAGEFLAKLPSKIIFISQPTWPNHKQIFERSGLKVETYPYYDPQTCLLDFNGMCQAIKNMPSGSCIVLHGCCHNPTGIDPTFEQWKELSVIIKKQQVIPLFDVAYQGFNQNPDQDAQAVRYFISQGHEMFITYSFSKNFGLYGERVGFLLIACSYPQQISKIGSHVKDLIRSNYSNPPLHGARIVSTILNSSELKLEWQAELQSMCMRVKEMRKTLVAALQSKGHESNFDYLYKQNGLFTFLGLTPKQVHYLRQEKGLYMPINGRINNAGLNEQNVYDVAEALLSVM